MELSIIIPVFNEEARIKKTLSRLEAYLRRHFREYEIIVVNDGSRDKTAELLRESAATIPALRVFSNKYNTGKGHAVKQGILEARADLIFFTDADLSTPAREIGRFVRLFEGSNASVLIGSRSVADSKIKIRQPFYREYMGKIFNQFVRYFTGLPFWDTQCGFKGFRRAAALEIFTKVKEPGFSFDVEVLLIAQKLGHRVEEIPVTWVNNRKSKVNPVKDSLAMFRGLLEIRQKYK